MLNYCNSITRIKFPVKPTGKYIVTFITTDGRGITRPRGCTLLVCRLPVF